eukprot:g3199.t1
MSGVHLAEPLLGGTGGERAPVGRIVTPIRAALGLTSMAILGTVGRALSNARMSLTEAVGGDSNKNGATGSYVPKQGLEKVVAKPGPPGLLETLSPSHLLGRTSAIFLYPGNVIPTELHGGDVTEGWLYGAKITDKSTAATITGHTSDVLKGKLLQWKDKEQFNEKLAVADGIAGYDHNNPDMGSVKRTEGKVVQKDGQVVNAYWYHANQRKYDYDLFVIGAGSGGVACARRSANYGAKVGLAEAKVVGGTCVNVGCIPKKLYVYGTSLTREIEEMRGYGWELHGKLNWSYLVEKKDAEILRLNNIYNNMLSKAGVDKFDAFAKITGPHQVQVGDKTYTAERIVIATGGKSAFPENVDDK